MLLVAFRFDQRLLARKNSTFCNAHTHTHRIITSVAIIQLQIVCLLRHSYIATARWVSGKLYDCQSLSFAYWYFAHNSLSNLFSIMLCALHVGLTVSESAFAQFLFQYRSSPIQCAYIMCCAIVLLIMCAASLPAACVHFFIFSWNILNRDLFLQNELKTKVLSLSLSPSVCEFVFVCLCLSQRCVVFEYL